MSTSESGGCRPPNPEHAVHFFAKTGIVVGMDRNSGRHGPESVRGEVTLDNPIQVWHAISGIIPGGSDVTGKVGHTLSGTLRENFNCGFLPRLGGAKNRILEYSPALF